MRGAVEGAAAGGRVVAAGAVFTGAVVDGAVVGGRVVEGAAAGRRGLDGAAPAAGGAVVGRVVAGAVGAGRVGAGALAEGGVVVGRDVVGAAVVGRVVAGAAVAGRGAVVVGAVVAGAAVDGRAGPGVVAGRAAGRAGGASSSFSSSAGGGARYSAGRGGPLFRLRVKSLLGAVGAGARGAVWVAAGGVVWGRGAAWAASPDRSRRAAADTAMLMGASFAPQPFDGKALNVKATSTVTLAGFRRRGARPRRSRLRQASSSRRSFRPAAPQGAWPGPVRCRALRPSSVRGPVD